MLEAWTPHEQPITKPVLQVPLLQSTSAHTCLAGDSCHFSCNEVHQLDPYALCIQASTRGPGILEEEIPCLQRAASVHRNEDCLALYCSQHQSRDITSWCSPFPGRGPATAAGTEARTGCKGDDGTSVGMLAEIKTCTRTQQEMELYFIAQMIDSGA